MAAAANTLLHGRAVEVAIRQRLRSVTIVSMEYDE
jgi:hypothetical protein